MGKLFEEYTESGFVVGEEDNAESQNIEMAIAQNENEDTSCALEEEEDEDDGDEGNEEVGAKPKAEITMV